MIRRILRQMVRLRVKNVQRRKVFAFCDEKGPWGPWRPETWREAAARLCPAIPTQAPTKAAARAQRRERMALIQELASIPVDSAPAGIRSIRNFSWRKAEASPA